MWDIRAHLATRETTSVPGVVVLEGTEATSINVAAVIAERGLPESLVERIRRDLVDDEWTRGIAKPGADLIQRWARQAHDAFVPTQADRLLVTEEGALEWQDADARTLAVAWHDESIVVVPVLPGTRVLEFLYRSRPDDAERSLALQSRYGLPGRVSLDWTGYFGASSEKVEGDGALARVRHRLRRAAVVTAGSVGVIVGRVVRVLGRELPALAKDPDQLSRLRGALGDRSSTQPVVPNLEDVADGSVAAARCAIFVHGTMSCGVPTSDLLTTVPGLAPLFRFEHDTFNEIVDNAQQLRELLLSKTYSQEIVLLCHSRGGLVGRNACQLMRDDRKQVIVWTFGTPHEGTPLVNAADRSLGMLYKLGGVTTGAVSRELPVSAAFRYMLSSGRLPAGIAAMTSPPSGVLKQMNAMPDCGRIYSFGASHQGPHGPTGVKLAFKGAVGDQLFKGEPNDLVVAVSSATARGVTKTVSPFTHAQYFFDENRIVRDDLQQFFMSP
jgi:hypothetical protein